MEAEGYLWFASDPNLPLSDITNLEPARQTKGDSEGRKAERPNLRALPHNRFTKVKTFDEVLEKLFGIVSP